MTSIHSVSSSRRFAALAVAGAALLAGLSACEERPYSVPVRQAATPARRVTELAGAPDAAAPSSSYVAPPAYIAPAPVTPPEQAYAPPPPRAYRPAPAYDAGEPIIVAMAPIPNPTGPNAVRHSERPVASRVAAAPAPARRVHHLYATAPHAYAAAPRHATPAARPAHVASAVHAKPAVAAKPVVVAAKPAEPKSYAKVATPKPVLRHPVSPVTIVEKGAPTTVATAQPSVAHPTTTAHSASKATHVAHGSATPVAPSDPALAAKVTALQTALTDAVSKDAVLTLPAQFTANQPADVSLTLPATFAETLHKEADKQGLKDAAASVNMTSVLAGDGYTVTPSDSQAQPLVAGQNTEFHWTVTSQTTARGPLHADVGADLLGGGSTPLSLGAVQKASGVKLTNQMWGAALLALIVVLGLAWLASERNRGARPAVVRRVGDRPLDMSGIDPRS